MHRARGRRRGRIEQPAQRARRGGAGRRQRGLDQRREQGGVLDPLVADPRRDLGRVGVADEHDGRPVERGVREAVGDRGGARPEPGQHDPRRSGQLGRGRRHDRGRRLAAGQHEVDALRGACCDQIEAAAAARDAEHPPHAAALKLRRERRRDRAPRGHPRGLPVHAVRIAHI